MGCNNKKEVVEEEEEKKKKKTSMAGRHKRSQLGDFRDSFTRYAKY